jgi:hypothetical protein
MTKINIRVLILASAFSLFTLDASADSWTWYNVPHVAAGGGWNSYLTIREPIGRSRVIWVYFYSDTGAPLTLNVDSGVGSVSQFSFTIGANQERVFALTGGSSVLTGQVQVAAQTVGNLNVSLRFGYAASGNLSDVVGIIPVEANNYWSLAVEKRQPSDDTGVAISNPYNTSGAITVSFDLYQNGARVPGTSTVTKDINPLGHLSKFVSELFPGVNYSGVATLKVSSPATTVAAVALRADMGLQYSSMPTDAGVQYWSVTTSGLSGTETWGWRFIDGYTFVGFGTNADNPRYRLRGVLAWDLSPQYFLGEYNWQNLTTKAEGVMIYEGTQNASQTVITGKRIELDSAGNILSTHDFTANRLSDTTVTVQ